MPAKLATAPRTTFLVDGFNVYHSVKDASNDLAGASTRWLDLRRLLCSYLPAIGAGAQVEDIFYFSALAHHRESSKPGVTVRHRIYIEALQSTNVHIEMGRFKPKNVWCKGCRTENLHHEEKETDVAISVKLFEVLHQDRCDNVVLVTGDTDLAPAARSAALLFPSKQVFFLFPYKRKNRELEKLVPRSFQIKKERYTQYQFADPLVLPSGRMLPKPTKW